LGLKTVAEAISILKDLGANRVIAEIKVDVK